MVKNSIKLFFLILFALNLFGCATTAKYGAVLDTWIGQNEGDLIDKWGPPGSVYEARGIKYLTYKWSSSGYVPGMPPSYQTTIVGGTVHTNAISGSPGYAYTNTCDTTFTIKNERIVTWRWKGNACTATEAPPDNGAAAAYNRGDFAQAIKLFRPLAEQGNAEAQAMLGLMYANGEGVAQNDREAVKWFHLAADQEHKGAQYSLGLGYAKAKGGITQDYQEAVRLFRLSAAQGHAGAQYSLGVMYAKGFGVTQDDREAVKWYRLAAIRGMRMPRKL